MHKAPRLHGGLCGAIPGSHLDQRTATGATMTMIMVCASDPDPGSATPTACRGSCRCTPLRPGNCSTSNGFKAPNLGRIYDFALIPVGTAGERVAAHGSSRRIIVRLARGAERCARVDGIGWARWAGEHAGTRRYVSDVGGPETDCVVRSVRPSGPARQRLR
jgi:hypothetical protein